MARRVRLAVPPGEEWGARPGRDRIEPMRRAEEMIEMKR